MCALTCFECELHQSLFHFFEIIVSMARRFEASKISSVLLPCMEFVLRDNKESIDLDKSFVQHGGHSLAALSLSSTLLHKGIRLPATTILRCEKLKDLLQIATLMLPTLPSPPESVAEADFSSSSLGSGHSSPRRTDAFDERTSERPKKRIKFKVSPAGLTEMQEALVLSSLNRPGNNIIQFFDTYAPHHIPELREAWRRVINNEDFPVLDIDTGIETNDTASLPQASFKWSESSFDRHEDYLTELHKPCTDFTASSFFRIYTLCRDGLPHLSTIVWNVHHALVDGYSASLLYRKVHRVANGLSIATGTSFREVGEAINRIHKSHQMEFRDFWQRKRDQYPSAASEIVFSSPQREESHHPTIEHISISLPVMQLRALAQSLNITVATVHYAIWSLVLAKFTDSDTVLFGAVISGRTLPITGILDTIGPTINTLPFHTNIGFSGTIHAFLASVSSDMSELESLQASIPEDGFSRAFFSAIAVEPDLSITQDTVVKPLQAPSFKCANDIPINVLVSLEGGASLIYQNDKLEETNAQLITEYYTAAAQAIIQPEQTLTSVMKNMTPDDTYNKLLRMGNALSHDTLDSKVEQDLVTLFETIARQYPFSVALEKGDVKVTYQELDRKAAKVAKYLVALINEGDVICVHADRSINFIVAIYAILKAGAVYAPLDPSLPAETRNAYYELAQACLFIVPGENGLVRPRSCQNCVCIAELLKETKTGRLPRRTKPLLETNAYVCFTSGSTGRPKAVLCHQRGLVAFQMDEEVRLSARPGVKISQIMSPAFDGSIHEIFSALSYGATLILPMAEAGLEHLSKAHSTILTPSLAKVLSPKDYPDLQKVYLVGEHVPQFVNDVWASTKVVYNMYGTTEATCGATITQLHYGEQVTIGRPNPTSRVYVLNRNQQLLPPGCTGDIYLAGVQVSRGYIGQPELTNKHFFNDPHYNISKQRMYNTGDRGFWDESGNLHFLGRNDRQVKLNGFRLDLHAIEESISHVLPETTAVAVIIQNNQLLAFLQPSSMDCLQARSKLSNILAPYAMPRQIVALGEFPMTAAGKLDYKELGILASTCQTEITCSTLRTPVEEKIEQLWRELLKLNHGVVLDRYSDFAALGGHSLLQLTLANRLTESFGHHIEARHVIEYSTLGNLAQCVSALLAAQVTPLSLSHHPASALGKQHISPIELEWCRKYESTDQTCTFNVSLVYQLDPEHVDIGILEQAWNQVLARHEILRSRYSRIPTGFERHYHCIPPQVHMQREVNTKEEVNRPFKVNVDHLFRVFLSKRTMLVCASHIICDLTTMSVLVEEVILTYQGRPPPSIPTTYAETTAWSRPTDVSTLAYWEKTLKASTEVYEASTRRKSFAGTSHVTELGTELSQSFFRYLGQGIYTPHQVVLAAVSLVFQFNVPKIELVLGGPYMNRTAKDMRTVGLFLEPLPILLRHTISSPQSHLNSLVESVRACSQAALAHAVPFSEVVRHMNIEPRLPNHPLFDTMVTFHDDRDVLLSAFPGGKRRIVWSDGAKFELMCEFTALQDERVILRIEYDDVVRDEPEVVIFESMILAALDLICSNATFSEAQKLLNAVKLNEAQRHPSRGVAFGALV